ncbi:hypothetical protein OEB99_15180 [Actinotalea sp. M2MS4P-6]|uniref:transaldolase family protein n=1 Tax=Actinotalea sp. M2MS4P-6 TaxID=2983762 RepID=UPI0021E3DE1D|nr:transaldolase family protein [Actinotalea sp. M2MS4P-6]MCV2395656.1 hypothetical protein [Actinotalea sp. M2MS4P-6]
MLTVNQHTTGDGQLGLRTTFAALDLAPARGHEEVLSRVGRLEVDPGQVALMREHARAVAGSDRFHDVLRTFPTPAGETPPGFRIEAALLADGLLEVDLVRDIGYGRNGERRPTGVIFSADSANPYEVAPVAGLLGNLTCNPGIVYDLFINNPDANIGHQFTTLEEVMGELGSVLGPGADVSVELENPFEDDFDRILAEIEPYERLLSRYRLVVKVPHTGPVNAGNVSRLLTGDGRLPDWYADARTEDSFRSHNLALRLREHGYRINYTLMFEPYQAALALQAKPYFINAFVRHRLGQSMRIRELVELYHRTHDRRHLEALRTYLVGVDHLSEESPVRDLVDVLEYAEDLLDYRRLGDAEGADGLDSLRHSLRLLKQCHLDDTRIIVCSMEGPRNYPDIDKLTVDPEFADVIDRLIITAEPAYLARFASASHVVSYQRRFMAAAATSVHV